MKDKKSEYFKSKIQIVGKIVTNGNKKVALVSRFHLTIGGPTGYSLSLPGSEFKMKSSEDEKDEKYKTTHYFYRYDGTEIIISDSGDIKIDIKNADLSSLDPSQFADVRIKADSTVSDMSVALECGERICRLKEGQDDRARKESLDRDRDNDRGKRGNH